eukprot:gnl/TRDRNA2_/TRDRNA2_202908_c0_seq1.p1 gnl/TRDRNA2_/TRDRNA2_202908_c0~~gnl/TRDRNA2_/TRDRNA2_202908_c0_seq1.p1  ORF type:complete len:452 (+),score=58.65 gnl/TRDRNA2_/TRDRNA2_202908_c0_seq1:35-1357(+)
MVVSANPSLATEVHVSDQLDGGSITVVSLQRGPTGSEPILLKLKKEKCLEACGTFQQWFHFVASNLPVGEQVSFCIEDAGSSTYPDWHGYKVCLSYDLETWHRIADTEFDDAGKLTWRHAAACSIAYYAYFPPYGRELQLRRLGSWQCSASGRCRALTLGQTLDGRDLHLLCIGEPPAPIASRDPKGKLTIWCQARQHPGETAASWWIDGFVGRLLQCTDPVVREVLKRADLFVVPNANPDGGVRGHLRTNACGANLNREWACPSAERSPEVLLMQQAMRCLGSVDMLLDIHQDEEKPYAFISKTSLAIPSATLTMRDLHTKFRAAYNKACPDFETPGPVDPVGYPEPQPGKANLAICSAWVAENFGNLSCTLEMPYKGNPNAGAKEGEGWTTENCVSLGRATLDAILEVLGPLKDYAKTRGATSPTMHPSGKTVHGYAS